MFIFVIFTDLFFSNQFYCLRLVALLLDFGKFWKSAVDNFSATVKQCDGVFRKIKKIHGLSCTPGKPRI
jgi:hypothetical protein